MRKTGKVAIADKSVIKMVNRKIVKLRLYAVPISCSDLLKDD